MTAMAEQNEEKRPDPDDDIWAKRRGKNIAIFSAIVGLAVLFFVITILRMG